MEGTEGGVRLPQSGASICIMGIGLSIALAREQRAGLGRVKRSHANPIIFRRSTPHRRAACRTPAEELNTRIHDMSLNLLTKEQLRDALNLPSTRMVDELVRRRKIPVIRLGYRTVRFDLAKVEAAIERLELKSIGQK